MNRVIKKFYNKRKNADYYFEDILTADFSEIYSDKKGVYVLMAKDTSFLYPNKKESSIFYIGMSKNLKRRLMSHQKWRKHL